MVELHELWQSLDLDDRLEEGSRFTRPSITSQEPPSRHDSRASGCRTSGFYHSRTTLNDFTSRITDGLTLLGQTTEYTSGADYAGENC
ncbi:hypothetical protein TSAR_008497 [Trichomalopsis sarcophagae]|uniref:Uncharacterized protein n=1 Tax=Trichomalopsis sarcophagae TaxID=543379 RepID=A0A232ET41_9HYME|nr:hypothetical protein TSAR_008497 [Trichomalopsis sarcophagae]